MRRTSVRDMNCSVAQCVEVVGDWWTMLILRDVFLGLRRFDEIQRRLGLSRNVLTQRLELLVEHEVLQRVPYQERPPRFEYRLTDKGRDLWPVLDAMRRWGDTWAAPDGPPLEIVHESCGATTHAVSCCASCGEPLAVSDVRAVPGPGARPDNPLALGAVAGEDRPARRRGTGGTTR